MLVEEFVMPKIEGCRPVNRKQWLVREGISERLAVTCRHVIIDSGSFVCQLPFLVRTTVNLSTVIFPKHLQSPSIHLHPTTCPAAASTTLCSAPDLHFPVFSLQSATTTANMSFQDRAQHHVNQIDKEVSTFYGIHPQPKRYFPHALVHCGAVMASGLRGIASVKPERWLMAAYSFPSILPSTISKSRPPSPKFMLSSASQHFTSSSSSSTSVASSS